MKNNFIPIKGWTEERINGQTGVNKIGVESV